MSNQKLKKALKYQFRSVFIDCPDSDEELFSSLKHCISLFEPQWVQNLIPSSEESIREPEGITEQEFGKRLPDIYKMYLQNMGANDGELLVQYIFKLDYYSDINQFQTKKDQKLLHFDISNMAEEMKNSIEKIKKSKFKSELTASFLWYLLPNIASSGGFAFTFNEQNPDEIVMSYESAPICYDSFSKQIACCEYLKAVHWIEDNSEQMKRKKWNNLSCFDSDSIFCACFRAYCPVEWMEEEKNTGFPLFAEFLEKIESRFYLEESWFSRDKVFPKCDPIWNDDYHTFFSRYIAFSLVSDLTLLIELHPKYYDYYYPSLFKPFIQVHMLGKDIEEMNEIIDSILQQTTLFEIEKDKSRIFGKMAL